MDRVRSEAIDERMSRGGRWAGYEGEEAVDGPD